MTNKLEPGDLAIALLKTKPPFKSLNNGNISYQLRGDVELANEAYASLISEGVVEKVVSSGRFKVGIATKVIN